MSVAGCGEARRGVTAWAVGGIRPKGVPAGLRPKGRGLQIVAIHNMETGMEAQSCAARLTATLQNFLRLTSPVSREETVHTPKAYS